MISADLPVSGRSHERPEVTMAVNARWCPTQLSERPVTSLVLAATTTRPQPDAHAAVRRHKSRRLTRANGSPKLRLGRSNSYLQIPLTSHSLRTEEPRGSHQRRAEHLAAAVQPLVHSPFFRTRASRAGIEVSGGMCVNIKSVLASCG